MPLDLSFDPLDVASSLPELKQVRLEVLQAPITCSDGNTFQFARDDREQIEGAILGLSSDPEATINWRLLDNTEIAVDSASLAGYLDELRLLQAKRGLVVDAEYMAFKVSGFTRRDLASWKLKYSGGFIPEL